MVEEILARVENEWGTGDLLTLYAPSLVGDQRLRRWWNRCERFTLSPATAAAFTRMMTDSDVRSILSSILWVPKTRPARVTCGLTQGAGKARWISGTARFSRIAPCAGALGACYAV